MVSTLVGFGGGFFGGSWTQPSVSGSNSCFKAPSQSPEAIVEDSLVKVLEKGNNQLKERNRELLERVNKLRKQLD